MKIESGQTDQSAILLRIFVFGVVLQRCLCGDQDWLRALPVAVATLCGPQVPEWWGSWALQAGRVTQVGHLHREEPDAVISFQCYMKPITSIAVKTRKEVNPTVCQQKPAARHPGADPWSSASPSIPSCGVGDLFQIGTWSLSWPKRDHHLPLTHHPFLPHLPLLSWSPPPQTGETAAPQIDASGVWGTARGPSCSSWSVDWSSHCPSSRERVEKSFGWRPRRCQTRSSELMIRRSDTAWCELSGQADRSRCKADG